MDCCENIQSEQLMMNRRVPGGSDLLVFVNTLTLDCDVVIPCSLIGRTACLTAPGY